MMIRTRAVVTSLAVALPAAVLVTYVIERGRTRDLELAALRVVQSQVNDQVRERCESDPTWFLTGPLEGRPANGLFIERSPDDLPPRPRVEPQPFELFAYDEAFVGSSSASARFPQELRRAMRSSSQPATLPFETDAGTGVQVALPTGWTGGPCVYFLGRMAPPPNQLRRRLLTATGVFAVVFAGALLALVPTIGRIRRLAKDAHEAVDQDYRAIAPDRKQDELSSLTFVFNDSSQSLHERRSRIEDLDEALRRVVRDMTEEIAAPLAGLERRLGSLSSAGHATGGDLQDVYRESHDVSGSLENLLAATRLKSLPVAPPRTPLPLDTLIARVLDRQQPFARAAQVQLVATRVDSPVTVEADESLLERALINVIDNAIRYNQPGGTVTVNLQHDPNEGRFRLFVVDSGQGVTDEQFRGLTAVRRFRGDESRNRRPGAPGLGLTLAREICDRYGLRLDLKRPASGGFEVEISGPA
jgi:signal transduction histidine kinase